MVSDAFQLVLMLYGAFFTQPKTLAVLGWIGLFMLVACLFGLRARVFSRKAIANSLTSLGVLAGNVLLAPVVYLITERAARFHAQWGLGEAIAPLWQGWPLWATILAAVILKDFSDYWVHRVLHTRALWPIHAVHHSDTHVNGFTTFRVHALELVLMGLFYIVLLSGVGLPAEAVAAAYVITALHNAYVHFEVDIDHGRLNWLLSSPRFHRWHHADVPDAYGKNLANMIPLWDILFGTLYRAGRCEARMGAEAEGIPGTDPARLFFLPFQLWARRLGEMRGNASPAPGSEKP
ncbi:MAG: sterol desaturase family protein [Beijerinckiaceae bacterium]|nr:sterol desaturase family protein [Beijerinckiaceae bacterium]